MVNASQVDLQRLKVHILAFAHFHGVKVPRMLISNPSMRTLRSELGDGYSELAPAPSLPGNIIAGPGLNSMSLTFLFLLSPPYTTRLLVVWVH